MAALSLQVGALNRSISAPDAQATEILGLALAATGGPVGGTNAQQADWVLDVLRKYLVDLAQSEKRQQTLRTADAGVVPIVWGT